MFPRDPVSPNMLLQWSKCSTCREYFPTKFLSVFPEGFSYHINQNNQYSNWEKILGFRNMQELSNCVDPFLHTDLNNFLLKRKMGKCARRIHHLNPFSPFVSKVGHPSLCITQILQYTDFAVHRFCITQISLTKISLAREFKRLWGLCGNLK